MTGLMRFAGYAALGSAGAVVLVLAGGSLAGIAARLAWLPVVSDWILRNLGWSSPIFALLIVAWLFSMRALGRQLREGAPSESIGHIDQLNDTWAQLCFGVGVIWTAIGMRNALVWSLSTQGEASVSGADRLALMVDGGILLALSTTIVGGITGYLMRVTKTLIYGEALRERYRDDARADVTAIRDRLEDIRTLLEAVVQTRRAPAERHMEPQ
jgi:hypothetical protein